LKLKTATTSEKSKTCSTHTKQKDINDEVLRSEEEYHEPLQIDEDLQKVLLLTDTLLAELPEEILNQFIHSKEFELYERY